MIKPIITDVALNRKEVRFNGLLVAELQREVDGTLYVWFNNRNGVLPDLFLILIGTETKKLNF